MSSIILPDDEFLVETFKLNYLFSVFWWKNTSPLLYPEECLLGCYENLAPPVI